MSVKVEVQWSPVHYNKFITWGTEICLYETSPLKDNLKSSHLKLSETSVAQLLATNSNYHYIKCIDIYPKVDPDILLAIGQANGKVAIASFGPTVYDSVGLTGKEFVPKHARQCNTLSWNPSDTNFLVVGLDKYRTDNSVLLWDIVRSSNSERIHHHGNAPSDVRPVAEACVSETIHSLAWFNRESKCLVAGVNNKQLKIIDFRDLTKVVNTTPTKAVYSLSVNPHNDYYLVSHIDNQITIWDTRYFEKPVLTLPQTRQVSKVLWCPTRHNLLGSLQKDSGALHLHDIQHCGSGSAEDAESGALERTVAPPWTNPTSFSWHPTHVNRLLAMSQTEITDYTVYERITLNWSARSHLSWNHASKCFKYICSSDSFYKSLGDISILTKTRALAEYGLMTDLSQNGDLAEHDTLRSLWHWLGLSRQLVEDGTISYSDNRHPGVRTVLKLDNPSNPNGLIKSELILRPWSDIGSNHTAKIYKSAEREKALQLCGWRFDRDFAVPSGNSFLDRLEREGEYSRAAAICVFNLNLRQAIDILNRGASKMTQSNLNIFAMALSGFSDDKSSMWRQMCIQSRSQLSDPYLRATFAFLTADSDSYETVLNENGMSVEDRVAFALTFLSDAKLCEYLKRLTQTLVDEGDLAGFLLTGASLEGIQLLNRYLDITGDVQSCSLIAIRALPTKLLQENQVQVWINSYRNLLDSWKMWTQRAHFDIAIRSMNNEKCPPQIYISCNFCGKSISAYMQGLSRARGPFGRLGSTSNKLKMSACPSCRKPLPRCAICLMHMGTGSGLHLLSMNANKNDEDGKLTPFNSWFTWCQTCKHGGHAEHITNWFQQHTECPVTSCSCRCFSLDALCREANV